MTDDNDSMDGSRKVMQCEVKKSKRESRECSKSEIFVESDDFVCPFYFVLTDCAFPEHCYLFQHFLPKIPSRNRLAFRGC